MLELLPTAKLTSSTDAFDPTSNIVPMDLIGKCALGVLTLPRTFKISEEVVVVDVKVGSQVETTPLSGFSEGDSRHSVTARYGSTPDGRGKATDDACAGGPKGHP